jgi:hypothetical protein
MPVSLGLRINPGYSMVKLLEKVLWGRCTEVGEFGTGFTTVGNGLV